MLRKTLFKKKKKTNRNHVGIRLTKLAKTVSVKAAGVARYRFRRTNSGDWISSIRGGGMAALNQSGGGSCDICKSREKTAVEVVED